MRSSLIAGCCGNQSTGTAWDGWISNGLRPYLKSEQVFICPDRANGGYADPFNSNKPVSYCYNYYSLAKTDRSDGTNASEINEPASGLAMWDSDDSWADNWYFSGGNDLADRDWLYLTSGGTSGQATQWHNGMTSTNFVFTDGHVKAAKWQNLLTQNIVLRLSSSDPNYNQKIFPTPTTLYSWQGNHP